MKKLLLTTLALLAVITLSAQTNLTQDCSAIATSGNAAVAVDGNNGTRWESASSDPQTWQVDLGEAKTFNTIAILWEGAYGKTFTIEAGNTVGSDGYLTDGTQVVAVTDQTLADFPCQQTFKFTDTNARYIKFNGIARGTQWGYSFFEFAVYNLEENLTLTSLNITASTAQTTVGNTINFTSKGKDQLGGGIDTGTLTWESSNPTVGTIENGIFTALAAGTTTITAKSGSVSSNAVELTVSAGAKIDLFTNWQYRIYPLGDKTISASRDGLVDENDGSLWVLHDVTSAVEADRIYETGFIADLGAIYDINNISIHFEGACSEAFTLSFAGNDGAFGEAVYSGGVTGINNHTETFSGQSVTGARYVKFLSTKASSEWGVKIYDFSVVGTKTADVDNSAIPVFTAAEATATDDESVTFSLTATDANSAYVMYELAANGVAAQYFGGKTSEATTVVIDKLASGTTYNFAIFSIDAAGNRSAIKEISATTTGDTFVLTAAPVPTKDAADVMSIYSNAYTPATAYNYGGWGQSTVVTDEKVGDDDLLMLSKYNYLGFEYATQLDLSEMTHIHIDILPMQAMDFSLTPILTAGTPTENSKKVGTLKVKEWNSIDIPLSQFGMDFTNLSHQLKIAEGKGSEVVYIDNIYFYKGEVEPVEEFVLTAAPAPTHNEETDHVFSIFSDAYTSDAPTGHFNNWGGGNPVNVQFAANDQIEQIDNFQWVGHEFDLTTDLRGYTLHVDVLSTKTNTIGITPITQSGEKSKTFNITAGQWTSLDIPATDWESPVDLQYTFQLKFDGGDGVTTLYIDNIYFYKTEGGDEPVEQATSGEETAIIESTLPEVNGKELKYTWAFTQEGKNVTITFACTNASEIPGIVDGYIQDKTDGFAESAGLTKTWSNCTEGQILKVAHKWEFAGGAFITPDFTYTVKAEGDIPQESIVKTVQLLGTWNWDVSVDNLTLTKQADANVWTGTLDLTDIYGDQEFKLVVNGGGDENDNWAGWIGTNKVTVEAPAEWGVFSGTEDNMNMTLNHGKTGYKTYTITATWTEGDNYYEGWTLKIEGKDKADLFVKFVNGKQWNEVYAYTWGVIDVSWPGYKLEKTGTETINGTEYDVYTWNLPAEITGMPQYVIFSDGTGGTGGETQTQNLEFVNGKTYYDMAPVPATIYSIVGELTGGWDADADMTQDADNENIYTLVVEDFEATAEGYQYKLRKNHQWGEGEIPAAGNYTWNPEEVGATYDLTFTFNLSEGTLTLDAVKQSASIVLDTEALDAEIAAAEDLIKDVDQTEGPAKTLADAIAAAKEAKSAATTQDDITTALQTLQTAVAAYKTTTGINTIKLNPADGIIYDLNGRRVLNPAKGIYIQNGRRVVIK